MKLRSGFTLVELIIVVAIIAILSAVAFIGLSSEPSHARDARRLSDLSTLNNAIATSNARNTSLDMTGAIVTSQSGAGDLERIVSGGKDIRVLRNGKALRVRTGFLDSTILPTEVRDPQGEYYFIAMMSDNAYQLYASLENAETKIPTAKVTGAFKAAASLDNLLVDIDAVATVLSVARSKQFVTGAATMVADPGIDTATGDVIQIDREKMVITKVNFATDELTVVRGFNSTAVSHSKNASIKLVTFANNAESLLCEGDLVITANTGGDTTYACAVDKVIKDGSQVLPYPLD